MKDQNYSKVAEMRRQFDAELDAKVKELAKLYPKPPLNPTGRSNDTSHSQAAGNDHRRDQFLKQLSSEKQVKIMRWAEKHGIRNSDPMWMLVDMLSLTQHMTDTLPNQMRAAGQLAVEAIQQQRRAEADAFSLNAQKVMTGMLEKTVDKISQASSNITDARLKTRLIVHGLWVSGGILLFMTVSFMMGFVLAHGNTSWVNTPSDNQLIFSLQVIMGFPIGYLIMALGMGSAILGLFQIFRNRVA